MKRTIKILTSILLLLTLVTSSLVLTSCGEEAKQVIGAKVVGGELSLIMSDGSEIGVGKLPENEDGLSFTKATVTAMNILQVTLSDGKAVNCGIIPTFADDDPLVSVTINDKAQLVFNTKSQAISLESFFLTAYGACSYATTRDVTGRDTVTVEIMIRDYGAITLLLDRTTAPVTVDNFVKLANEGFYNGLTIHRVRADFMIQGGCTKGDGTGGSSTTIKGEFSSNKYYGNDLDHIRGVISMARSGNNMDSASSQFFICNADSPHLNGAYAAFGYVINGMSIVDAITTNCAKYAIGNSNVIPDKSKQPVIEYVRVVD